MASRRGLSGRIAVVTGGAFGIGRGYARRLAADGAQVVVADIEDSAETEGLIRSDGGQATGVRCDISDADEVGALATQVLALGGADILVHNAAIYPVHDFDEISFDEWRRVLAVNLDALFLLTKAFLPRMRERQWGRIVGISSSTFHLGAGSPAGTHYVASKGAVIGFVRSLAADEGRHGITVNAIAPGLVHSRGTDTALTDLGFFEQIAEAQAIKRNGMPEDVAGALSFLVSEDASWITGQTLLVDGGMARG